MTLLIAETDVTGQCLANFMTRLFVLWMKIGNVSEILKSPKQRAQLCASFWEQELEACSKTCFLILPSKLFSLVIQLL